MKYVIDPSEPFTGAVITQMSDDLHCDYYGKTIEELRIEQNNPRLTTITPEEVANLVNEHRRKLNTAPFVEIDEERYWDLYECLPPARVLRNCFFVGECYQYDLYPFVFKVGGRFFEGKRVLNTPKEELYAEIQDFHANLTKSEANGNKS
ncbi:hypothetical protein [uncultured Duncaniella sp.]|uniref:hypothetical protein n=1 Tax=uncultured Duncaniella sp. TaxID=2768039 RepID=UPI002676F97D|nr:hypothetical protein [uncultured Duncaniella sp.]